MQVDLNQAMQEDSQLPPGITIVPTIVHPDEAGDRLQFDKNRIVNRIDTELDSPFLASGLQIIDLEYVGDWVLEDFKAVWIRALESRRLRVSSIYPSKWLAFDNPESLVNF